MPRIRKASHADSWYEGDGDELNAELEEWLRQATSKPGIHAQAIIGPHAGYRYSGPTAAYAYKQIDPSKVQRVFLLGPSHHHYTKKCCLSTAEFYETPLGNIPVDRTLVDQLEITKQFEIMSMDVDEAEHSLEMHAPYIKKVMGDKPFQLVPIMVGSVSFESAKLYGQILAPYVADPSNLFVISSDFCHWGARFRYTFYDKSHGPIWKSIEALDKEGMRLIESRDPAAFYEYLRRTENTICGRNPILVFMHALQAASGSAAADDRGQLAIQWVKYDQSSHCETEKDSSVSYASAVVVPKK